MARVRTARPAWSPAAGRRSCVLAGCGGDDAAAVHRRRRSTTPTRCRRPPLTDTDGQPFSLADDTDKRLTLVFFGYTNCVDICPAVLNHLASAMTRLDDADRDEVDVVLVTSDPEHDTPESLRTYLDRFDDVLHRPDRPTSTPSSTVGQRARRRHRRAHDPGGHTTQILGDRRRRRGARSTGRQDTTAVAVRRRHPHPPRGRLTRDAP